MTTHISTRFQAATQSILSLPHSDIIDIIKNIDMTRVNNLPGLQALAQSIAEMRDHSLPGDSTLTNDTLYGAQGTPFRNLKEELLKRQDILEQCPDAIYALAHDAGVINQVCRSPVIAASPATIDFILQLEKEEAGEKEQHKDLYWLGLTSNPAIKSHPEGIRALMATCLSQTDQWIKNTACENLAANPAIEVCTDVIDALAQTDHGFAQYKLAENKAIHASPETILSLVSYEKDSYDRTLASNEALSACEKAATLIFNRNNSYHLRDLAGNTGIIQHASVVKGLAEHPHSSVRSSLARNEALDQSSEALETLSRDTDGLVLGALAANPAIAKSQQTIDTLVQSKDPKVLKSLIDNAALAGNSAIDRARQTIEEINQPVICALNDLLYSPP